MRLSELPTQGRNFRPVLFQTAERGLSETTQDLREGGLELPTHAFSAGRGPFVGPNTTLPMGVGTSDLY